VLESAFVQRRTRVGALAAAGAAACFGVTVPLVQRFGQDVGPWWTAALLYSGAAVAAGVPTKPTGAIAKHAARVVVIALLGAAAAPAMLAAGLKRIDAATASLLLGSEAVFTVLLSHALYREPVTRRLALALAVMVAGAIVLVRPTLALPRGAVGSLFVLLAVACWASDSALMRPLAELPRTPVVRTKSLVGVAVALVFAACTGERLPSWPAVASLAACGAVGYGVSLRLYLVAQQHAGAMRTATVFSVAPFFGALVALALGSRGDSITLACAGALLAAGVVLQATDTYQHQP